MREGIGNGFYNIGEEFCGTVGCSQEELTSSFTMFIEEMESVWAGKTNYSDLVITHCMYVCIEYYTLYLAITMLVTNKI